MKKKRFLISFSSYSSVGESKTRIGTQFQVSFYIPILTAFYFFYLVGGVIVFSKSLGQSPIIIDAALLSRQILYI
jgi:hypothetical protein